MALIDHALADPAAAYLLLFSIVVFALSLIAMPWVVARLPSDYFVRDDSESALHPPTFARALMRGLKNALGAALIVLGVAMLVLPGQGVLTVLVGLSLLNFPGKRQLERRMLGLPGVTKLVTALRRRAGRPPLILE